MSGRTKNHFDLIIVGGGIAGLAHALAPSRRGLAVAVFERHAKPRGGSIRNFGMLWPIGQPPGKVGHPGLSGLAL